MSRLIYWGQKYCRRSELRAEAPWEIPGLGSRPQAPWQVDLPHGRATGQEIDAVIGNAATFNEWQKGEERTSKMISARALYRRLLKW